MKKNILLTGASGFLGSQICKDLLKLDFNITAIDIKKPNEVFSEIKYLTVDLDNYLASITNFDNYDFVIHAASMLPYKNSIDDIWNKNYLLTKKIVDRVSKSNDVFFIYISSSAVYGKVGKVPVNQNTELNPLDTYGKSKVKSEQYIQSILNNTDFSIIRPRTILGNRRSGIFDIFFNLIKYKIPIPIPNKGNQKIQFVEVRDLSRLTIHIAENNYYGIWPAAGPETESLNYLLTELSKKLGRKIFIFKVNVLIFEFIGKVLTFLKLTNFTPWHFGAFPYDFYFDEDWVPKGFNYQFTSSEAFQNTAKKFFNI